MIIYRPCIATSHSPAKYLWSPKKCIFCWRPILITELHHHPMHVNHQVPSLWIAARGQEVEPFLSAPRTATIWLNTTLIPDLQVSPATQAVCHHMGMCRAPPPSRPTITLSPQAWMDTALLPCPIWAVPQLSWTAQLPTHPTPVSRPMSCDLRVFPRIAPCCCGPHQAELLSLRTPVLPGTALQCC
jgi:hypothetical protein